MDHFSSWGKKYHGLYNQGATCYLNSVLQVLFMTEDFRAAVGRTSEEPSETIDHRLKTLFDDLKTHTAHTYDITDYLGIYRVNEQSDAAEYYEKILSKASHDASQIFRGLLTHRTRCTDCSLETNTDAAFWHLPLALVDSDREYFSVEDGIMEYFRASDFSGQNQMYCDRCDDKSDSTIQCIINHYPEVVMLLLKRFGLNYTSMTYVKNNCTVDIPYYLLIPQNQAYELYAIVEHYGNLRGGHYSAKIKSQDDGRWYIFNDTVVTLLKRQLFQGTNNEISSSAYLLFYRKKTDTWTRDYRNVSLPGCLQPVTSDCQNAVKMREREEDTVAAEEASDSMAAESFDRNEKTRVELPPDHIYNVDDRGYGAHARQSRPINRQKSSEDRNDAYSEKQRAKGKINPGDQEYMRDNAVADDQKERGERPLEESVDNQDSDVPWWSLPRGHINTSYTEQKSQREAGNMHARHDNPRQVSVDMQKDKEIMAKDVMRDERKMKGDEQSEKRGKASRKDLDLDAVHRDVGGLDYVRPSIHGTQGDTKEVGQDRELKGTSPPMARARYWEDTMEGRHGPVQSRTYGKISKDKECKETAGGIQRSRETENIGTDTGEGTSQAGIQSWAENYEGIDPKMKAKASLSDSVYKLNLSESPVSEPQTGKNKQVCKSHAQAKMKCAMKRNAYLKKRKFWHHSFWKKNQVKKKKTTRCFSFGEKQKNAEQTSESD